MRCGSRHNNKRTITWQAAAVVTQSEVDDGPSRRRPHDKHWCPEIRHCASWLTHVLLPRDKHRCLRTSWFIADDMYPGAWLAGAYRLRPSLYDGRRFAITLARGRSSWHPSPPLASPKSVSKRNRGCPTRSQADLDPPTLLRPGLQFVSFAPLDGLCWSRWGGIAWCYCFWHMCL